MIAWIKDKKFKGKREKIDHDLIAYGVSRDGKTAKKKQKEKIRKEKRKNSR